MRGIGREMPVAATRLARWLGWLGWRSLDFPTLVPTALAPTEELAHHTNNYSMSSPWSLTITDRRTCPKPKLRFKHVYSIGRARRGPVSLYPRSTVLPGLDPSCLRHNAVLLFRAHQHPSISIVPLNENVIGCAKRNLELREWRRFGEFDECLLR